MRPGRGSSHTGGSTSSLRDLDPDPHRDGPGPWTLFATVGPYTHTLLTLVSREEAELLLDGVRCDDCGGPLSGVPPWESESVVCRYVCRNCLGSSDEYTGTEFELVEIGSTRYAV